MITIKEARENNLISAELLDTIPVKCRCGSDYIFTESLTELQCSNPKCIYKIAKRAYSLTQSLNLKSWTEQDCTILCEKFKFTTPFQILLVKQLLDNKVDTGIFDFSKKVKEIEEAKEREIELWKIVKYANIRYLGLVAKKLFGSYDSMTKAYDDIERGQVAYISEKLGIENNETSAMSIMIYNQLLNNKEELMFAETQFNILKHQSDPIRIAISGGTPGYLNKTALLTSLNNKFYEYTEFVLDSVVTEDTKILLTSYDKTSTKYRTAKRINEKYISQSVQNEEFDIDDIGKFRKSDDLLAIGERIAIVNEEELITRLNRYFHCSKS
jgi:hypothetical protein